MAALVIPELTLQKIIDALLLKIKLDHEANVGDVTKSLLYRYFNGLTDHKKNYYTEAVDLFTREKEHARYIQTRMFFDASRAKIPTVHITMPSDQQGQNSIGVGEYGHVDHVIDQDGERSMEYERRFDSQYQIVCTSDNHSETLLMYHTIRAGLISVFDSLSINGLENAQISGQELKINPDLVPNHIYMRAIGLRCSYDIKVPRWWSQTIISEIIIGDITPTIPE